jgi:acyl carrier protein
MTPDDARSLLTRLLHAVAPEVDLDGIRRSAALQEEAELDSMDFLNLVTALYEETGIDVPERDYPAIATVDGFVAYVTGTPIEGGEGPDARLVTFAPGTAGQPEGS